MEKKKPEIRFNGFEGEWVTTTLGECFLERVERSAEGELISVTISQGVVRASDLDRIDNSSNDKSNYKVVEVGDIAYNSMRMWQGACGYSLYKGICSPAYTVVIPQNNIDVVCCFYLFKRNETLQLFRVNSQGLTSDTWNLKYPAFSQIKCSFPSLSEQENIGLFLTTLDKLIAKLEAKLDKLRKLKQALLEKMFVNVNRGGYETPEIRFKGYTDKWQVNNVASIFETYYDKNHPNLPVLSASQEFGMVIRDNVGFQVQHNKENEVGYKRVLPGQFVIHLRSFQGGFAHSMVEGITSPAYTVMQFKNSSTQDDIYWKYVLTSKMFIKRLETVTYGIRDGRSISFEDFSELDFTFPSLSEQEQIGKCFTQIDTHFNKTSTKLTKLRNIKQSLLQKMFA